MAEDMKIVLGTKQEWDAGTLTPQADTNTIPGSVKLYKPTLSFTRASTAYLPDGTQVGAALGRYWTGKFSQAILVEEGTTNQYSAIQSQGQAFGGWNGSAMTSTIGQADPFGGTNAVRIQGTGGTSNLKALLGTSSPAPDGVQWTGQIWIRNRIATVITVHSNQGGQSTTVAQAEGWKKIIWTITGNGVGVPQHQLRVPTATDVLDCDVAFVQYEAKPYATSWQIGGTTRTAETLTIPTTGLSPTAGSVEFWWTPQQPISGFTADQNMSPKILQVGDYYYNGSLTLWAFQGGVGIEPSLRFFVKGATNSGWSTSVIIKNTGSGWYTVGTPIQLAIRWINGNTFHVAVAGVLYGPYTIADAITTWSTPSMWLGTSNNVSYPNAYYDDVRVSTVARTDVEMIAPYTATGPLTADANTLAHLPFDNSLVSDYPSKTTIITKSIDLGPIHTVPIDMSVVGTTPNGTSIKVKRYQTSVDNLTWGVWKTLNPDNTIVTDVDQYIRFEVELSTTIASTTPVLDSIEIYKKGNLGYVDLKKKAQTPSLFLARPSRAVIGKLKETYTINQNLKLGSLHELTFFIPYEIEIGNKMVKNPNIDKIKEKYLIKSVLGSNEEWYEISTIKESTNDSSDSKEITAMLLPYELRGKLHRGFNTEESGPKNLTQITTDALSGTLWTVGYVDASFDIVYRSFDFSGTALDFIFQIAETFKTVIVWDTVNREINFYKQENVGINKGLVVSYNKYLKTLNKTVTTDEMVTRLKVYGKDNLSIHRLNSTGTDYLEDFSFFLYPFQRDINKNVIQSSDYMSDSLANAILDYQDKVESKQGEFDGLVSQKSTKTTELSATETDLFYTELDLILAQDQKDIQQSYGTYYTETKTHNGGTTTIPLTLKGGSKHAVMAYVSSMTGLTATYGGASKTIPSGTWTVIGKEDTTVMVNGKYVNKSVSLSITGATSGVTVKVVTVKISEGEFIGAAVEGATIKSDGVTPKSVLTTTDPETSWRLANVGDTVYIETGVQAGWQFSGTNTDLAGIITAIDKVTNKITLDRTYTVGTYANGYLVTTSNNDSVIIIRYNVEYNESAVAIKQSIVNAKKSELTSIDSQIATLRAGLAIETNFTVDQIKERNLFIIEKEWVDQNYVYDTDLYGDAKKKFDLLKTPQTIIDIDIVNFLEVLESQNDWDKLVLGDTITIKYEKFNVNVKAKIIEIDLDYESGEVKLVIANVKDIEDDTDKLIKMLYKSNSTSATVDMNKFKWSETSKTVGEIDAIINSQWDATKRAIVAGVKESVTLDARGLTITDSDDPLKFLRATHGVLGITNDGGNTFKHAITSDGIVGERIYGQIIMGANLFIGDADGVLKLLGNKGVVYDRIGTEVMKFGLYETEVGTGIEKFGLQLINPTHKVIVDKDSGFKIQKKNGANWDDIVWLDVNGKLNLNNIIASGTIEATTLVATTQLKVGNIDISDLIANGLQTNNNWIKVNMIEANSITADKIKVGELIVGTNVTMGAGATISWGNVTAKPSVALTSDLTWDNIKSTAITAGGITTPYLASTAINGMTITGATVQTAVSGNRIVLNQTSIMAVYNAITKFNVDITTGDVYIAGNVFGVATYQNATIVHGNISVDLGLSGASPMPILTINGEGLFVYNKSPLNTTLVKKGAAITNTGNLQFYSPYGDLNGTMSTGDTKVLFNGSFDFAGATVSGLSVTAKFA